MSAWTHGCLLYTSDFHPVQLFLLLKLFLLCRFFPWGPTPLLSGSTGCSRLPGVAPAPAQSHSLQGAQIPLLEHCVKTKICALGGLVTQGSVASRSSPPAEREPCTGSCGHLCLPPSASTPRRSPRCALQLQPVTPWAILAACPCLCVNSHPRSERPDSTRLRPFTEPSVQSERACPVVSA